VLIICINYIYIRGAATNFFSNFTTSAVPYKLFVFSVTVADKNNTA